MLTKICNIHVLAEEGMIVNGEVYMQNGEIVQIGQNGGPIADLVWDGQGMTVVPGFIDLHVHGGAGHDFMDHTEEAVKAICRFHSSHGTTSLLATTITAPIAELEEVLSFYKNLGSTGGAEILGVHLEGPFINPRFKGAQNGEWIVSPSLPLLKKLWNRAGNHLIRMVTLAPELVEEEAIFAWLSEQGTILAVGHSDLDYHGGCRCIRKGVNHATHLGNAMRAFHHRNIGIIGLAMERAELTFDVIADGIHVSPEFIRLLTRVCAPEQILLITDAMRAAGLKDGHYELGGLPVVVHGGEARLHTGVLAGSLLTLDHALANMMKYTGLPLSKTIHFLSLNPARKLGLAERKGSIKVGKDADLVLLGHDLKVRATWVRGQLVFQDGLFKSPK